MQIKRAVKIKRLVERWTSRAFFACLCFLILGSTAELGARMLLKARESDLSRRLSSIWRVPKPYVMFSNGFCDQCDAHGIEIPPKARGEYRIFMLGGSTVFGPSPALPQLLEEQLVLAGHSKVRVFNYGVISQNATQELLSLVLKIIDLKPDLIVSYDGGNDIQDPAGIGDPRPGYPVNFLAYESNPLLEREIWNYPNLTLLAYGSAIGRYLLRDFFMDHIFHLDKLKTQAGFKTDAWYARIAEIYVGDLEKMKAMSSAYGVKYLSFFQPLRSYSNSKLKKSEEGQVYHDRKARRFIRTAVKNHSALLPSWHDLSDTFVDDDPVTIYTDSIHLLPAAQSTIIRAMLPSVIRLIK